MISVHLHSQFLPEKTNIFQRNQIDEKNSDIFELEKEKLVKQFDGKYKQIKDKYTK